MNFLKNKIVDVLFAVIALISLFLMLAIPPFQKTDEISHFYKTIQVASGNFFCKENAQGVLESPLPKPYYGLPDNLFFKFVNDSPLHKFPKASLKETFFKEYDFTQTVNESVSCTLPFIFYLPVSIVLSFFVFFKANPLVTFYVGRLAFFLLGFYLFWLAKRLVPGKFRYLLLLTMSLPMTMIQVGSYNKEVIHLGFGLISFALLLNLRKSFSIPKFLFLVISVVLYILPRPYFFPMFMLVFIVVPRDGLNQIVKKYGFLIALSSSFIAGMVIYAVYAFSQKIGIFHLAKISVDGVSPQLQILYLKTFPLSFISTLFDSYINHMDSYYKSLIGTLGSLHYYFDWFTYSFFGALIIALSFFYSRMPSPLSKKQWLVVLLSVGSSIMATFVLMYIYATPVGQKNITDVQGRYFITFIPLFILLLAFAIRNYSKYILVFFSFLALILIFHGVFSRYYDYKASYAARGVVASSSYMPLVNDVEGDLLIKANARFRGIALNTRKIPQEVNTPYLVTIYSEGCAKKLGIGLVAPYQYDDGGIIETPIDKGLVFTVDTYICYKITPLGGQLIPSTTPLEVQSNEEKTSPLIFPLYDL